MMTTFTQDQPYYQRTRDNRRAHICSMPGHTRYWLNSGAALWVCERCHPPVGDVAIAMVWELVGPALVRSRRCRDVPGVPGDGYTALVSRLRRESKWD